MRIITRDTFDLLSDAVWLRLQARAKAPGSQPVRVTREDGSVVFAALRDGRINETAIESAVDRRLYSANGMRQPLSNGFIVDRKA